MTSLQAHSNLLIARLQRSDLFAAGLPALWQAAPLLREAEQWLRDVEASLPSLPEADVIPLLSNYDLLHRLTRRRPGTPLLRLACRRILDAWADADPTVLPSYVYDAARLLQSLSPNSEFKIQNSKFKITSSGNQFKIQNSKFKIPLSDYPEQISLLRISVERGAISPKEAVSLLTPIYDSIPFAPAEVLHALLLFTVRCRHLLSPLLDPEAAIRRINRALSVAPDNHPLDRQARLQHLDNDSAYHSEKAASPRPAPAPRS